MRNYVDFYRRIYDTIGDLTPISRDCGKLCSKRCCHGSGKDGMLLFPHEEELLDKSRITDALSGRIYICGGNCDRSLRPLACRIFPLLPIIDGERIRVAINAAAYRICPLVQNARHIRFEPEFIRAVRRTGRLLYSDDECRRYITDISDENSDLLRLLPIGDGIISGKRI